MYEQVLVGGLQFPISLFIKDLLLYVGIAPTQLMPNLWRIVIGYMVLWAVYSGGSDLILNYEFLFCYQLVEKEVGLWYFTAQDSFRTWSLVFQSPIRGGRVDFSSSQAMTMKLVLGIARLRSWAL